MRRYLADTNILTAYLFQRQPILEILSPWIAQKEASTSILVYGEMVEYLKGRADFARHREELRDLLKETTPFDRCHRFGAKPHDRDHRFRL